MAHLSSRLDEVQVKRILEQYCSRTLPAGDAQAKLGLKPSAFFALLKRYRTEKAQFVLAPAVPRARNKKRAETDTLILDELKKEHELIANKDMPISTYNYSAIADTLTNDHNTKVSVSTIISRAKEHGYYLPRPERKAHTRIVATDFIGELVQHDASLHLWSPYMKEKLTLITSLDDHSRVMLYAEFFPNESAWHHIEAAQSVFQTYGCPLKYYADQHSIFRYVKNRDQERNWQEYTKFTDDVDPQWKQVMKRCGVEVVYALSPQAKGKIERPYRWLQDRVVRIAVKEKLTTIDELRDVLRQLRETYNNSWVHSTTKEIPVVRFEKTLNGNCSLFRPLAKVAPGADVRDLFCLRFVRKTDGYRRVSLDSVVMELPNAKPVTETELRCSFDENNALVTVRCFQMGKFVEEKRVKAEEFKTLRF
jgi:hypothetical protein